MQPVVYNVVVVGWWACVGGPVYKMVGGPILGITGTPRLPTNTPAHANKQHKPGEKTNQQDLGHANLQESVNA